MWLFLVNCKSKCNSKLCNQGKFPELHVMQKDLGDYRKTYEKSELTEASIKENPLEQFQKWFYEVEASEGVDEPNAMTISTIGLDGFPKSRVVLMKKFTFEGFIFYSNYQSEKGRAITADPSVCLSFFGQIWNVRSS